MKVITNNLHLMLSDPPEKSAKHKECLALDIESSKRNILLDKHHFTNLVESSA